MWGPLLVLIVLLSALRGLSAEVARWVEPGARPGAGPIDIALDEIRRSAARQRPGEGTVEVLRSGLRVPAASIVSAPELQAWAGGYYSFRLDGEADVTASAMGTDWRQHIVHSYLVGIAPFQTDNYWLPLQVLAQRKRYQYDHLQHWSRTDVWQTSAQAITTPRGDCEDHALALADWLISLGADARVVIGRHRNTGHAWVVLLHQGQEFLFEATQKDRLGSARHYPLAATQTDYRPRFMFNREYFWANTGSESTTRYQGDAWVRKSRYIPAAS